MSSALPNLGETGVAQQREEQTLDVVSSVLRAMSEPGDALLSRRRGSSEVDDVERATRPEHAAQRARQGDGERGMDEPSASAVLPAASTPSMATRTG